MMQRSGSLPCAALCKCVKECEMKRILLAAILVHRRRSACLGAAGRNRRAPRRGGQTAGGHRAAAAASRGAREAAATRCTREAASAASGPAGRHQGAGRLRQLAARDRQQQGEPERLLQLQVLSRRLRRADGVPAASPRRRAGKQLGKFNFPDGARAPERAASRGNHARK